MGDLNVHIRGVHEKVRHKCHECEKAFFAKAKLKSHIIEEK